MRPEQIFIGLVIFSIFLTTGVLIISDVNNSYNVDISTDGFNNTFKIINETYNISRDIESKTYDQNLGDEDSLDSMAAGAFGAVRFIPQSYKLINGILTDLSTTLRIPVMYVQGFMIIVLITITWFAVYFVRGFKPSKD